MTEKLQVEKRSRDLGGSRTHDLLIMRPYILPLWWWHNRCLYPITDPLQQARALGRADRLPDRLLGGDPASRGRLHQGGHLLRRQVRE